MIAFLSGTIQSKNLRAVVVLTTGVGYRVHMPLSDISRLGDIGENVSLHIHTHVRDDAIDLFGFLSDESLVLFEHLINVSGVGPKLALALLSGMDTKMLASTLINGDHLALTRIPGVGQKTAQRLVLELKDRLQQSFSSSNFSFGSSPGLLSDLRSAIANLGYKTSVIDKAVKSVEPLAKDGLPLESLVKEALRHLN